MRVSPRRQTVHAMMVATMIWTMLAGAWPAWAQGPAPPPPIPPPSAPTLDTNTVDALQRNGLKMNFEDVDIKTLARIISQITGRNIVLDQKVQGKVTIASSHTVTPDEAWEMFVSALEAYGFGIEEADGVYRVSPLATARLRTMRVYPGRARSEVAVVRLNNVPADQMVNTLRPLLSPTGVVSGMPNSNTLVIADEAVIVRRAVLLARKLDRETRHPVLRIYYPRRVRAADVQKNIEGLFPDRTMIKVTVHQPTNSLMVMAPPEAQALIERMLASVERRDQVEAEPREFWVVYLQHASSDDLAKILGDMLAERQRVEQKITESGVMTAPSYNAPPTIMAPAPVPANTPVVPANPGLPGFVAQAPVSRDFPNVTSTPYPTGAQSSQPTTGTTSTSSVPGSALPGAATTTGFASQRVSSDPTNNALVFYMPRSEFAVVRRLVEQLDIPRKQVLISAVIAEVSLSRVLQTGVNWQAVSNKGVLASFGGGLSQAQLLNILQGNQFVIGGIDKSTTTISVNGQNIQFPNNFALLQFLQTNNDFNLVSSPRILTHNNKEAEIKVGQVTPFATGARFDINGQPIINFDYREVGLDLRLTPHISQQQNIRLELHQKLQEVVSQQTQGVGAARFTVPVTSNREVNTEVSLQDGQTLVIGGLIERRTLQELRKIPVLGDIPILGKLFFQNKNTNHTRTNLFIFITPHIVDSPQKLKDITDQYNHLLEGTQRTDREAVERQDYHPTRRTPEPVLNPGNVPAPGPAPTPIGPTGPSGQTPSEPEAPAANALPDGPPPRTDRGTARPHPGPPRSDASWQ